MNSVPGTKANAAFSNKLTLSQLTDACAVVSVLEDQKVKAELLKWFICECFSPVLTPKKGWK